MLTNTCVKNVPNKEEMAFGKNYMRKRFNIMKKHTGSNSKYGMEPSI
jgi:hypothetical protein